MVRKLVALSFLLALDLTPQCYGRLAKNRNLPGIKHLPTIEDPIKTSSLLKLNLSNGQTVPLVGVGVEDVEDDRIEELVNRELQENDSILIDVSNSSTEREEAVAAAIAKSINTNPLERRRVVYGSRKIVNIIAKVPHMYHGYERTQLSVKESLKKLRIPSSNVDVRVHMLLEWSRCIDNDAWLDCEEQEIKLPEHIQRAGPPPYFDSEKAWKESWKALEDMYSDKNTQLASIGVSNLGLDELEELVATCRIKPHLLKSDFSDFVHDRFLVHFLRQHEIVFLTQSMRNGGLSEEEPLPNLQSRFQYIGKEVNKLAGKEHEQFSAHQLVLAWLSQNNISVLSSSATLEPRDDHSPESVSRVPKLTGLNHTMFGKAILALLAGKDVESHRVKATFINMNGHEPIELYWRNSVTGREKLVDREVGPGDTTVHSSYCGHVFVAYAESKAIRKEFKVTAAYGSHQFIPINLSRPKVKFANDDELPVDIYFSANDGREILVSENLQPGEEHEESTWRGHTFVVYEKSRDTRREIQITSGWGEQQNVHIEL